MSKRTSRNKKGGDGNVPNFVFKLGDNTSGFGSTPSSPSGSVTGFTFSNPSSPATANFNNFGTLQRGQSEINPKPESSPLRRTTSDITLGTANQSAFTFGQPPAQPAFGAPLQKQASTTSLNSQSSFSAPASTTGFSIAGTPATTSNAFSFTPPSNNATNSTPASAFSFGSTTSNSTSTTTPATGFGFGTPSTTASSGFSFGTATTTPSTSAAATPSFTFGTPSSTTTTTTAAVTSTPSVSTPASAFSFGTSTATSTSATTTASSAFSFGTTTPTTTSTMTTTTTSAPTPSFTFGTPSSTPAQTSTASTSFSFGASTTAATPSISLGTPTTTTTTTSKPLTPSFTFGTTKPEDKTSTSTTTSKPAETTKFSFGATSTSNDKPTVVTSSPFTFGTSTASSTTTTAPTTTATPAAVVVPAKPNQFSFVKVLEDLEKAATSQVPNQFQATLIGPALIQQTVHHTSFRIDHIMPTTRFTELPEQAQKELDELEKYIRLENQRNEYIKNHKIPRYFDTISQSKRSIDSLSQELDALSNTLKCTKESIEFLYDTVKEQLRHANDGSIVLEACKHPGNNARWLFGYTEEDDYFLQLSKQLSSRLEEYKKCIWEIERTAESWTLNKKLSPQDIADIMRTQNEAFMALSSKVAALHESVNAEKNNYSQYLRMYN